MERLDAGTPAILRRGDRTGLAPGSPAISRRFCNTSPLNTNQILSIFSILILWNLICLIKATKMWWLGKKRLGKRFSLQGEACT